jgi:hypothetical protein
MLLSEMAQSCHLRSRLPAAAASFAWRELDAVQWAAQQSMSIGAARAQSGGLSEAERCAGGAVTVQR